MNLIVQEDPFGCAIACVAVTVGISYGEGRTLFNNPSNASSKGYYCKDIVEALERKGLLYTYRYIKPWLQKSVYKEKIIVYIKKSRKYPAGHFLTRLEGGWHDPWINFPNPNRKAGIRKRLPGSPIYIIYPITPISIK